MADPTGSVILSQGKREIIGDSFEDKSPAVNVGHLPIKGAIADFQNPSTLPSGTNQGVLENPRVFLDKASARTSLAEAQRVASEAIGEPLKK